MDKTYKCCVRFADAATGAHGMDARVIVTESDVAQYAECNGIRDKTQALKVTALRAAVRLVWGSGARFDGRAFRVPVMPAHFDTGDAETAIGCVWVNDGRLGRGGARRVSERLRVTVEVSP